MVGFRLRQESLGDRCIGLKSELKGIPQIIEIFHLFLTGLPDTHQ